MKHAPDIPGKSFGKDALIGFENDSASTGSSFAVPGKAYTVVRIYLR